MPFKKGHTTNLGRKLSEKTRQRMSFAHKKLKPSLWGAGFKSGNVPWNKRGSVARNAYFAGLVDGEGNISIHKNMSKAKDPGGRYKRIAVRISMVDGEDIFLEGKRFWGGWIYKRKTRKGWNGCFEWVVQHGQAEKLLKSIQPFLRIKKNQADLALKYRYLQKKKKNALGSISDEEMVYRKKIEAELKSLHLPKGTHISS